MTEPVAIPLRLIVRCAAEIFGVSERLIYSRRRDGAVSEARLAVYWMARELTTHSFPTLGRMLGGRDHTTVMAGARAIEGRRQVDPELAAKLDALHRAVVIVASSEHAGRFADPVPAQIARRIIRDPLHEATHVSVLEAIAIADRLLDLEQLAADTFALLAAVDERQRAVGADREPATSRAKALIAKVSSGLTALGFTPTTKPESEHGRSSQEEDQDRSGELACAAE